MKFIATLFYIRELSKRHNNDFNLSNRWKSFHNTFSLIKHHETDEVFSIIIGLENHRITYVIYFTNTSFIYRLGQQISEDKARYNMMMNKKYETDYKSLANRLCEWSKITRGTYQEDERIKQPNE